MVAYSFKKRFGPLILAGTKGQTIRADRKRHARPGEELQLYTGMRTRQCQLLGRAPCLSVMPVCLCFSANSATAPFEVGGAFLSWVEMEAFAKADGFEDIADMARFWWAEHPPKHGDTINFKGVLIRWQPLQVGGMSPKQRELARHALGLPNDRRKSYRNRFLTGGDCPDWRAMEAAGLAESGEPDAHGRTWFWLTRAGADAALMRGERLCPEDFTAPITHEDPEAD